MGNFIMRIGPDADRAEEFCISEQQLRNMRAEACVMMAEATQRIEGEEPLVEKEAYQLLQRCAADMPEHMLTTQ